MEVDQVSEQSANSLNMNLDFVPKIEINIDTISRPSPLEMDQLIENLKLQYPDEQTTSKKKSKRVEYEEEWLDNDGLIRPEDYSPEDDDQEEVICDDDDSDFERDDVSDDEQTLQLMAPIPLQRQRGQIFRTFDVSYALG